MLNYRLIETTQGFAYEVYADDGSFRVYQEFTPGVEGNVSMGYAEAEGFAQQVVTDNTPAV